MLIHFGIQRGAAHIVFHIILTMVHTITDMAFMDHTMIILIIIITQTTRLLQGIEIRQVIEQEIITVEEVQTIQDWALLLQDAFISLLELLLLPVLQDQQLLQEAEHTQMVKPDLEAATL